jgi:hypothetical protein
VSLPGSDIAIAYRVYPHVSGVPLVYPEEKFALAEACLQSFRRALGTLSIKIWVILDGCPVEYESLFRRLREEDLTFITLPGVGNQTSFSVQVDTLMRQTASELVYFAEDDYFYLPRQMETLVRFFQGTQDADFVTPYDHPDYYTLALHSPETLCPLGQQCWRRVSTTCLTFLTSKTTLRKTQSVFRTYQNPKNLDASIWLSLTKRGVFDVRRSCRLCLKEQSSFKMIVKAWLYNGKQILWGQRWTLWAPVPSLATHMDSRFPAPGLDWVQEIKQQRDSIHANRH